MATPKNARQIALPFPEVEELPHFHLTSFRIKKKIFATLDEELKRVMVKLNLTDQSVFCSFDKLVIYPVSGGWERKGATYIELEKVKKTMIKDALTTAYCNVAPILLAKKFLPQ